MKKVLTVKVTKTMEGRIMDAKVDQVEFLGITNKYGLTAVGYQYKNYIQYHLDRGYEMQVVKEVM